MNELHEEFSAAPGPHWRHFLRGQGLLEPTGQTLRLVTEGATASAYSDAQIDDYQGRLRRDFLWRPPLVFTIRARFSHPAAETGRQPALGGTAGFGFWNDPFLMTGLRPPALPRAIWFFYASPPSDMNLDLYTPGGGWKAATIDAARWPVRLLLPLAPLAIPFMAVPTLYRNFWPLAQRLLHVREARVSASMTEWHTYNIEWGWRYARFHVDGQLVMACDTPPRGPLGLVIWNDNQYLVATPWGRFRYGMLDVPHRQWLEVASLSVDHGESNL